MRISNCLLRIRPAFLASFLKKILRIKRRAVNTVNGRFVIDPASNFGNAILSDGVYEPEMVSTLRQILNEGDTFLDIGANEGYFSILASKCVGNGGRVISIEPQSRLQSVLFKNIGENSALNITVLQTAISDSMGIATLSLLPDMNTGGSGLFRVAKYRVPTETVPQITLSHLFNLFNIPKVKLLKMDIESFEYEAILGSKELFVGNRIENIALELHPAILHQRGKTADDILGFLKGLGYRENEQCKSFVLSKHIGTRNPDHELRRDEKGILEPLASER